MRLGLIIRALRQKKDISLRKLAQSTQISKTYLSSIENKEIIPSEKVIRIIAQGLGANEEELLYRSGRLSSELTGIIMKCPREFAHLIRAMARLNAGQIAMMAESLNRKI